MYAHYSKWRHTYDVLTSVMGNRRAICSIDEFWVEHEPLIFMLSFRGLCLYCMSHVAQPNIFFFSRFRGCTSYFWQEYSTKWWRCLDGSSESATHSRVNMRLQRTIGLVHWILLYRPLTVLSPSQWAQAVSDGKMYSFVRKCHPPLMRLKSSSRIHTFVFGTKVGYWR